MRDMWAKAAGMDRLQAIVWFNENKERDWCAAPTPEVAAAFADGSGDRGDEGLSDGGSGGGSRSDGATD